MNFDEWWKKVEELNPPEILVGCRDLAEDAWDYKESQLQIRMKELVAENKLLRHDVAQLNGYDDWEEMQEEIG